MELGLTDRRVLVVGATGGIGGAVCRTLVREGVAGLALGVRDLAAGDRLARELRGGPVATVHCDLSDPASPARCVAAAEDAVGPLDGLAMCAGDPPWGGLWELDDADWERAIGTTLLGPVRAVRALVPGMVERGHGRVVLVAGLNGRKPAPGGVVSAVVCAGLASFATAVAKEVVASGVTVNVVDPHLTDTPRWRRQVDRLSSRTGLAAAEAEARLLAGVPRGRPVPPQDVADLVVFLLSDRAASIAGSALAVDAAVAPGIY